MLSGVLRLWLCRERVLRRGGNQLHWRQYSRHFTITSDDHILCADSSYSISCISDHFLHPCLNFIPLSLGLDEVASYAVGRASAELATCVIVLHGYNYCLRSTTTVSISSHCAKTRLADLILVKSWGQATVLINDVLFVHGGKTDQFNSYSYNSAPNTNDVLYLPLSDPFAASQPPWELVSSSANQSTSQGPAVSWHTLSAFNNSDVLLFGGQPGPNSQTVVVSQADSAFLLDTFHRLAPVWESEPPSWGDQPVRRVYHTSATSLTGTVFIIGGQLADGSGNTFSQHYMFNPQSLEFSPLPSDGGPQALYGHASVTFTDGRLFVFGGASGGSLIPFSTIWVLDTTKVPLKWTSLQVDLNSLPAPRRAFVAVAIGNENILIQGGSDINLQVNFDDGWILDVSKNPAIWTRVDALTQVGPRRDHCAFSSNGQVIFAFGE